MASTKTKLLNKAYRYSDGTEGRSAKPGWTHLLFQLVAPEKGADDKYPVLETFEVAKADVPADMADCSVGHGLMQKLGDDLAGIAVKAGKEEPPVDEVAGRGFVDYALQRLTDMWDNISNGVWVEESEGGGGPSVTVILEATIAAFADAGVTVDEAQTATLREQLKTKEVRESIVARPDVKAHMARIRSERAAEAAKKAKAAAKAAGATSVADLQALLGTQAEG